MSHRVHRLALRVFSWLPRRVRRLVVRGIAPKYTTGSMCLIERHDGAVLLIRQVYRERWTIPGGLLARREAPEDGARREVREEVGIEVELLGEPAVVVDPIPQRVDVIYRGRMLDPDAAPRPTSPEIAEARWFPRDALPELQREMSTALVALARTADMPIIRPARSAGG